jgi:hypothetical protein
MANCAGARKRPGTSAVFYETMCRNVSSVMLRQVGPGRVARCLSRRACRWLKPDPLSGNALAWSMRSPGDARAYLMRQALAAFFCACP